MSEIKITRNQAVILLQALNEVCNGPDSIDNVEFHSRMGATKEEALKIITDLKNKISPS